MTNMINTLDLLFKLITVSRTSGYEPVCGELSAAHPAAPGGGATHPVMTTVQSDYQWN